MFPPKKFVCRNPIERQMQQVCDNCQTFCRWLVCNLSLTRPENRFWARQVGLMEFVHYGVAASCLIQHCSDVFVYLVLPMTSHAHVHCLRKASIIYNVYIHYTAISVNRETAPSTVLFCHSRIAVIWWRLSSGQEDRIYGTVQHWRVLKCTTVNSAWSLNKKLSYCWETVRRDSMPRIAEMDVEMTT